MRTIRLFDEDSRMTSFTGTVVRCDKVKKGYEVVLDRTAFFPEEGGQTCDRGTLGGQEMLHASEREGVIYHLVREPLREGQTVQGEIEWQKRFSDMQQHSGEHIVSGLMHSRFGFDNVGFHLGTEAVTMDFNGTISPDQLRQVEHAANEAVAKDIPLHIFWPDASQQERISYRSKKEVDGPLRLVEIPGYDICACCAPHVERTGQIGLIKITGMDRYKGGIRVTMLCGFRALADYNRKEEAAYQTGRLFSVPAENIGQAAEHHLQEAAQLRHKLGELENKILLLQVDQIPADSRNACIFSDTADNASLRRALGVMCGRFKGICAAFSGDDRKGWQFVLSVPGGDARIEGKRFADHFQARGGGSPEMFQGKTAASREEIEKYFREA